MTTAEQAAMAVELATLRGEIRTDMVDIKGSLAVLVERSNRTEQDVRDLARNTDEDIKALRADVEDVKRWRWMATGAAVAVGTAAGVVASIITG
ncbi:hypothetical protein O7599_16880 [Streptomyces sp. WMMC500]|uniref:hypothetical protein n=1 Tax=Streptomyces sp. WMMC500 TaxID=3015154 RepID=UPI00248B9526|nr:hypothetical protein [Streptomyces sp. WMMC500]WBB64084.1 hypothetical protein O7599_16880 [Streptomyces sp. WMMC500]